MADCGLVQASALLRQPHRGEPVVSVAGCDSPGRHLEDAACPGQCAASRRSARSQAHTRSGGNGAGTGVMPEHVWPGGLSFLKGAKMRAARERSSGQDPVLYTTSRAACPRAPCPVRQQPPPQLHTYPPSFPNSLTAQNRANRACKDRPLQPPSANSPRCPSLPPPRPPHQPGPHQHPALGLNSLPFNLLAHAARLSYWHHHLLARAYRAPPNERPEASRLCAVFDVWGARSGGTPARPCREDEYAHWCLRFRPM